MFQAILVGKSDTNVTVKTVRDGKELQYGFQDSVKGRVITAPLNWMTEFDINTSTQLIKWIKPLYSMDSKDLPPVGKQQAEEKSTTSGKDEGNGVPPEGQENELKTVSPVWSKTPYDGKPAVFTIGVKINVDQFESLFIQVEADNRDYVLDQIIETCGLLGRNNPVTADSINRYVERVLMPKREPA